MWGLGGGCKERGEALLAVSAADCPILCYPLLTEVTFKEDSKLTLKFTMLKCCLVWSEFHFNHMGGFL